MKHAPLAGLAALAAGLVIVFSATAQTSSPDISGVWKFRTGVLPNKGCVISGDIRFSKAKKPGEYSCSFISQEDCDRPGGPTFTRVQQSCSVTRANGEFVITSTIDKIVDAGPADFKEAMFATQAYAPDHFKVHPNKAELTGIFHSSREAPVRFWRDAELIG